MPGEILNQQILQNVIDRIAILTYYYKYSEQRRSPNNESHYVLSICFLLLGECLFTLYI